MLYSHNNKYPKTLPFRITLSDGRTRTDPLTFTTEEIADAGYKPVDAPPTYDFRTSKLVWDEVAGDWRVDALTQAEIDFATAKETNKVRSRRNFLLSESDWTQVADAPVDKEAWATYRQELRDITTQAGFPFNVVFPAEP